MVIVLKLNGIVCIMLLNSICSSFPGSGLVFFKKLYGKAKSPRGGGGGLVMGTNLKENRLICNQIKKIGYKNNYDQKKDRNYDN